MIESTSASFCMVGQFRLFTCAETKSAWISETRRASPFLQTKNAIDSGFETSKEPDQSEGSAIDETKSKIGRVLDELEIYVSDGMVSSYDVSQYVETTYRAVFDDAVRQKVPKLDNYPDQKDRFWKLIAQHFNLLMHSLMILLQNKKRK